LGPDPDPDLGLQRLPHQYFFGARTRCAAVKRHIFNILVNTVNTVSLLDQTSAKITFKLFTS
jgi:hypothetical protein